MGDTAVMPKPYQVDQIRSKKALRMGRFKECHRCGGDQGTLRRDGKLYVHPECIPRVKR